MTTFMNCPLIYWDTLYLFYWDTLYLFYWDTLYLFYPMFTGIPCTCSIPCLLGYPIPVLSLVYQGCKELLSQYVQEQGDIQPGESGASGAAHPETTAPHGLNTNIIFIVFNNNKKINKILKM